MKTILLFLSLFFTIPQTMPMQGHVIKSTVEITGDNLTVSTHLTHNHKTWSVQHHHNLKDGVNKFYFVLNEKQSINIELVNY